MSVPGEWQRKVTALIWGSTLGSSKTEGELRVLLTVDFHKNTLEPRKKISLVEDCSKDAAITPLPSLLANNKRFQKHFW